MRAEPFYFVLEWVLHSYLGWEIGYADLRQLKTHYHRDKQLNRLFVSTL
jgi:hypothetical protein